LTPRRWRGWLALALALVTLGAAACGPFSPTAPEEAPPVVVVATVRGPIGSLTADYLRRALNAALRQQAQALVVQLDTPGGAVQAATDIVTLFRTSPVPVVVYVQPRGAMAGSAGALITLAAHRAYMAPETVIGAATPVLLGESSDEDPVLQAKTRNILAAQARSLAEARGPTAQRLAEDMVQSARAVTASEAQQAGLVDGVAPTLDAVLAALDGQAVTTAAGERRLRTAGAHIVTVDLSPVERALALLTHPGIVLLLLGLGAQLLLIEFRTPGGWVAGTLGAVLLGLGLYGLGMIPSNALGLGFIALAFVLFVLEVKAPTHGALSAAGALAFVAGGWILFNTPLTLPQQRLSLWWAAALAGGLAVLSLAVMRLVHLAGQRPVLTGAEEAARLVGRVGWARTAIGPRRRGSVHIAGETWSAVLAPDAAPIAAGQPVRVVAVRHLVLVVRPADDLAAREAGA